jgi:hypothetical protein
MPGHPLPVLIGLVLAIALAGPHPATAQEFTVELVQPFAFADGDIVGGLNPGDVEALMDRPVHMGGNRADGVGLTRCQEDANDCETTIVTTCREYRAMRSREWFARSTYDMSMESFFIRTCGTLARIAEARPALHNFVDSPRVGVNDLHLLPPTLLPSGPFGPAFAALEEAHRRGRTAADLVAEDGTINRMRTGFVDLDHKNRRLILSEIARADFDGDGYQDILVSTAEYVVGGTYRSYSTRLLTRRSADGMFEDGN